jgi:multicomponent Na+:H+ antiporter subunit B
MLLPLLLLFSVFLLLRGHNEPGGGFAGGLVAAAAFALYAIAFGPAATRRLLRVQPPALTALGLLATTTSGTMGLLTRQPFLTGLWGNVDLPGLGQLGLGTPVLFDLGVYLAVTGVLLAILLSMMEET